MFLKILKKRIEYFDEDIYETYLYCAKILEFCEFYFPIEDLSMINECKKILKEQIEKIKNIQNELYKLCKI